MKIKLAVMSKISVLIFLSFLIMGGCNKGKSGVPNTPGADTTVLVPPVNPPDEDTTVKGDTGNVVLAGGYIVDSNTTSELLFSSGFNEEVTLGPMEHPEGNNNGLYWQGISGTDKATGFTWPIDNDQFPVTSPARFFMLTNYKGIIANPREYTENKLEEINGYNGKPNRCLYMAFYKGGGVGQTWYYINPETDRDLKQMYIRYRLRFPNSMTQAMEDHNWYNFFYFKTQQTDFRIEGGIRYKDGKLKWFVNGDHPDPNSSGSLEVYFNISNDTVPVPIGKWFNVEYYWYRSKGNDGRFFWSINGRTIVDYHGPTMTQNNIDRFCPFGSYGTNTYQWVDDFQMWNAPPCGEMPCIVEQPLEK